MTEIKQKLKPLMQRARATVTRAQHRFAGSPMDDPEKLHEFWRQEHPEMNRPEEYIAATGRSDGLLELLGDLPSGSRVLEVGCNVGRNLAFLRDAGYVVEGIEINPHAVEMLRTTYPQLAGCDIHVGPAEQVLRTIASDSFDLVFTMAVIEHIHPKSAVVFDRMAAVAPNLLAIEPPGTASHRQFPHDVPKLFESRGMRLVSKTPMSTVRGAKDDPAINWYTAYRFAR